MASDAPQWWESLPAVQSSCREIEPAEVKQFLEKDAAAGLGTTRDFLLVDVRQKDWQGGTVATSINLPAQTFCQTRASVYQLCKQAGIRRIIFYCGKSIIKPLLEIANRPH